MHLFSRTLILSFVLFSSVDSYASEDSTSRPTDGIIGQPCGTTVRPPPETPQNLENSVRAAVGNGPKGQAIMTELEKYKTSWESCHSKASTAQTFCLEQCSPHIQTGVAAINTLVATGRGAGGTSTQCGNAASIFDIVQGALSAFQATCGGAKALCHSTCEDALKSLQSTNSKLTTFVGEMNSAKSAATPECAAAAGPAGAAGAPAAAAVPGASAPSAIMTAFFGETVLCADVARKVSEKTPLIETAKGKIAEELNASTTTSIAAREKTCTGYTVQLLTAGGSIGSMIALRKQAKECEEATNANDCTKEANKSNPQCLCVVNPTYPGCPVDCKLAANSQKLECMCEANPRLPGCPNNLDKSSSISGLNNQVNGITATAPISSGTGGSVGGSGAAATGADAFGGGVDGSSSGGGGGGGPAPSLGGGGGLAANSGAKPGDANYRRGLSPNVLSTESGGGGGGWGGGRSAGAGGGSGLRSYLPGGAQDPASGAAAAAPAQITNSAGRSNFEKVTDRYQDNRGSLLSNR